MKMILLLTLLIVGILSQTCPDYDCGCSWVTGQGSCATNDGSQCYAQCCCEAGFYDPGEIPEVPTGWQTGSTTRYWDCCKPSCTWPDNVVGIASGFETVKSCKIDGEKADPNGVNICGGGGGSSDIAYSCIDNQPWYDATEDVMFGFVAKNSRSCCECIELEFTSTAITGKTMVVQVTNSGEDLGEAHFDIQLPGGGFGIFNGCARTGSEPANGDPQFPENESVWGERYGGISSISSCSSFPEALRPGCEFRFNHFLNADNPNVKWRRVQCPNVLSDITGCILADDADYPVYGSASSTEENSSSSSSSSSSSNDGSSSSSNSGSSSNDGSSSSSSNAGSSSSSSNAGSSSSSNTDSSSNTNPDDIDPSNEEIENKTILVMLSVLLLVSILSV